MTWLQRWYKDEIDRRTPKKPKPTKSAHKIEATTMPMSIVRHLHQLYGPQSSLLNSIPGTEPAENQFLEKSKTTTKKSLKKKNIEKITEDLSNIEFDKK